MANFPTSLTPSITGYSKNTKTRVLVTDFGDGYRQRSQDGINCINKEVSLEYIGTVAQIKVYTDFLESAGGAESFDYTLPKESDSEKWTSDSWERQHISDDIVILTLTIRKEFDL